MYIYTVYTNSNKVYVLEGCIIVWCSYLFLFMVEEGRRFQLVFNNILIITIKIYVCIILIQFVIENLSRNFWVIF